MSDFRASIKAILDTSGIQGQINDIQKQYKIKFTVGDIDTNNIRQQMKKDGANAGNNFAQALNSSLSKINLRNSKSVIEGMSSTLKSMNFNDSSIKLITQDLNDMNIAVSNVNTKLKGSNLNLSIKGVDELGRNVAIVKQFNLETEEISETSRSFTQSFDNISSKAERFASSLKAVTLENKMSTWLQKNSKASKSLGSRIDSLRSKLNTLNNTGELTEHRLNDIEREFKEIQQEAIRTGQIGKSVGATLTNAFKSIFKYVQISTIIHQLYETGKQLYQNVYNINTEMTELRKVSDETNSTYDKFLSNAGKKAKDLGTSISGLVSSTADFSRLGYDFDESQELARVANIYAVVGDEIESVDEATKSLVSTTAAFGEQVTAIEIIDKFNEIGNKFAISSGGIGEALQRSASSLVAAGNDLDQAIALITGGNKVVQDPDAVGTAYKTVSMRIRGAKTELEEEGLDVEGMAESVSELRAEIKAISGVDIMIDDDTFKSTFDIMDELSQKWESLKDIEQARIIELIAGKRQGNIISSLMTNFDVAHEALQVSRNADGSAMAEHAKWLESLEAKVAQFKATWEDLSQVLVDDSTFATFIDAGTNILEIITKIVETIGTIPALVTAISLSMSFNNVGELINQFQSLIILRIEHAHKVPNGNMNDTMLKLVA